MSVLYAQNQLEQWKELLLLLLKFLIKHEANFSQKY